MPTNFVVSAQRAGLPSAVTFNNLTTPTLTGVGGTASVGSVIALVQPLATGVEATSAIGIPVVSLPALVGVQAAASVGTVLPNVIGTPDGVGATASIGTVIAHVQPLAVGVGATASAGTVGITTAGTGIVGVQAVASVPPAGLLVMTGPNTTTPAITGVHATGSAGSLSTTRSYPMTGVQAVASVGSLRAVTNAPGMRLSGLVCQPIPERVTDVTLNLRWSDTKGQSWSDSASQTFALTGAYLTSLQFRRLGMARDRIIELSWSSPSPTALTGCSLQYDIAAT